MGVDYYNCHNCDAVFADCGEYYSCNDACRHHFCRSCKDCVWGVGYDLACIFCSNEKVTQEELLEHALERLGTTAAVLITEILASRPNSDLICHKEDCDNMTCEDIATNTRAVQHPHFAKGRVMDSVGWCCFHSDEGEDLCSACAAQQKKKRKISNDEEEEE